MSLIHTCELNGANPFDYLTEFLRHAEELKRCPSGVDAVELPQDIGPAGDVHNCVISWPFLAEKDRLRPCLGNTLKCPESRASEKQNADTFLARQAGGRKCCGQALSARANQRYSKKDGFG